jgi:hypothetical protein
MRFFKTTENGGERTYFASYVSVKVQPHLLFEKSYLKMLTFKPQFQVVFYCCCWHQTELGGYLEVWVILVSYGSGYVYPTLT